MSNVIILGDPHIGSGLNIGKSGMGVSLNSRVIDQTFILEWVFNQAIDNFVYDIIITGDVFDEPKPHPSFIVIFIDWLKKISIEGIKIHIIMGNHDFFRTGTHQVSPLDIISTVEIDNCFVYKDLSTFIINNTAFTLLPFRDRKSFLTISNSTSLEILKSHIDYEENSIPLTYTKVLVGHMALEGSIPVGNEIDDLSNEIFCPLDMFSNYDYVWMGHVHKYQVLQQSPYLAHIGSMDISNFGESDQKKYIIIYDTDNNIHSKIEIPTRPLIKLNINVPADTNDTTQFIIKEIESKNFTFNKSIVKVEITLLAPELGSSSREEIEKFIYSKGAFHIANFSEHKKIAQVIKIKDSQSSNINVNADPIGAIKMWADKHFADQEERKNKYIEAATTFYYKYLDTIK